MFEDIETYLETQYETGKKLDGVIVGSIVCWFDEMKDRPVVYSRVVSMDETGVMVDVYPDDIHPFTIAWQMLRVTKYGFTSHCGFKYPAYDFMGVPKAGKSKGKKEYKNLYIWPSIHHPFLPKKD